MLHSTEVFAETIHEVPDVLYRADCDPVERRTYQRKAVFAAGVISGGGLEQPLPCKVVDFSGFGARLEFSADVARYKLGRITRPDELKILIVAERSEAECRIMWRSSQFIGVKLRTALRRKPLAA